MHPHTRHAPACLDHDRFALQVQTGRLKILKVVMDTKRRADSFQIEVDPDTVDPVTIRIVIISYVTPLYFS